MLRVNHIIKILSSIKPYAPHTYKNRTDKIIDKIHGRLFMTGVIFLALLACLIALYRLTDLFRNDTMVYIIFGVYFGVTITGLLIMMLPPILGIKHLINWKKETSDDFVCEISHDEQNAMLLLDYSEKELLYAIHWLQTKINRINLRVSSFFGEKTAVLSVLALTYSAVQSSIGFDKLSQTFTEDLFTSGISNTFIMFGLAFLLGISLGALMLKKVANHQLYLKEIVELAIKIQKDAGEGTAT
ncbi:hypothetical protein Z042_16750 [Chania multitudinisentens RB-25]|uniref:Uncharacterized protein n=1 Tax=Chania multitudinisentens RB-25 TaxID=1441930 RepID=W0LF92_9GAMM|nr:hypothetical protein [Chania multitudinisentens]AHG21064.1 hypothetical protein Z042_16750 [Chania multitudinisentens RB-25]